MSTAIVLFRRDLRVSDQPALHAALDTADHVLPVYVHAPHEDGDWPPGGASRWWLHHSLVALDEALRARGAGLVVVAGDTLAELRRLIGAIGADAVHWCRCYEPDAIVRDTALKSALRDDGITVESHNGSLMVEPWALATGNGDPYRVYSPFGRAFAKFGDIAAPFPAPDAVPSPAGTADLPTGRDAIEALRLLPRIDWDAGFYRHWRPGCDGARERLARFFEGSAAGAYHDERDFPGIDGTSGLSPHLHHGDLSPREAWQCAVSAPESKGVDHFRRELIWREFAYHLIYHYPETPHTPLNRRFDAFPWRSPDDYADDLAAWQAGRTGVPIVDAGMRQLWHTGWMHNRVRMIVASFLTKNLLIPWQEGARWFWDTLVDADLASNTLGWQWAGGCGADAAPYFRIFNPVLQGGKFDGDGAYVRHWVPEIATLPDDALHAPWDAKPQTLQQAGIALGHDYPEPMVDLKATRQRALDAYERIKG